MTLMIDPKKSYVYNFTAQGKMNGKIKPITSGNFQVADKNIDFTVTSHFGSTLNIKYTGSINFKKSGIPQQKTYTVKSIEISIF